MINLRKIITHEKHISDIVHQFNTNNNFDLQHYLRMIDKTKYKDILPLSSKKAFNTFMQKTPHLKVKDILEFKNKYSNWTLKNFRSNNLKLSDIASDNKIKTFCDSNPNDEMCKCYYDIKTILENYQTSLGQYYKDVEEKLGKDFDYEQRFRDEYIIKQNEFQNHRQITNGSVPSPSCSYWSKDYTGTGEKSSCQKGTLWCWNHCQYTVVKVNSLLAEWERSWRKENPYTTMPYPDLPEIDMKIKCCIDNIQDILFDIKSIKTFKDTTLPGYRKNLTDICNQNIIDYIDNYGKCTINEDCSKDGTRICSPDNTCVNKEPEKECTIDEDCKDDTKKCSSDYKCVNKDPEKQCTVDKDCNDSNKKCSSDYKCVNKDPEKQCTVDKDCNDSNKKCSSDYKCVNKYPDKQCTVDKDCKDDTKKCSSDYKCIIKTPPPDGDNNLGIKVAIGIVLLIIFIGLCVFLYYKLKK